MPTLEQQLALLKRNPDLIRYFTRGIEREGLRVNSDGKLSLTPHPSSFGAALTHPWITTDFSESLLEFVTPTSQNVDVLLEQLRDIHHFSLTHMQDEQLWPFSMPCIIEPSQIQIAQYGSSNSGRIKTLYREGLKNRYGSAMQVISGVHFNFSFTSGFWNLFSLNSDNGNALLNQNAGFFALIRNYYRRGWIIPYLFGASPAICKSFLKDNKHTLPFESFSNGTCYLPYATSLRLSDLGYTSKAQEGLTINLNSLDQYVSDLLTAVRTPFDSFEKIGLKNGNGSYQQLNCNILQIENELYAPIRPKNVPLDGEKPHQALLTRGVNYVEVRSLDVNPFSDIGIEPEQVRFLDLFMLWCALTPSAELDVPELKKHKRNWNKIVMQGRDPRLTLETEQGNVSQFELGKRLFEDLIQIAKVVDEVQGGSLYEDVCHQLMVAIDDPDNTLSAKFLNLLSDHKGISQLGCEISKQHKQKLEAYQYRFYNESQFEHETEKSLRRQTQIEQSQSQSFDDYLADYFKVYA